MIMTKRILEILDNVRYWDTCPDDYKKDIEDFLDKQFNDTDCTVDLSKCKKGDILISRHGAKLEYISPTPWEGYIYLDHVVRYIEDVDGKSFGDTNYGTRTNDGFVFVNKRRPTVDHDIVAIIHK